MRLGKLAPTRSAMYAGPSATVRSALWRSSVRRSEFGRFPTPCLCGHFEVRYHGDSGDCVVHSDLAGRMTERQMRLAWFIKDGAALYVYGSRNASSFLRHRCLLEKQQRMCPSQSWPQVASVLVWESLKTISIASSSATRWSYVSV